MNLKEQTYVTMLARCGSISRAAERLFVSPPALSGYIGNLEKQMGTRLFDRSKKRFTLTYAGKRYVVAAEKMLEIDRQFEQEMKAILGGESGVLRIGIQMRRGPWIIPPLIRRFSEEYPDLLIEVEEGTNAGLLDALKEDLVDIIQINENSRLPGLKYEVMMNEPVLVVLPASHPACALSEAGDQYPSLSLDLLKDETFILGQMHQSIRIFANDVLKEAGIVPRKVIEIQNIEAAVHMAAEGLGVAFTRLGYVKYFNTYDKTARYFLPSGVRRGEDVVAVWKEGTVLTPPMARFVDLLREICNSCYNTADTEDC